MSNKQTQAILHFTLATAGHVDHGKTSLLRALTGIDPDRLKEEKEREMTTDIGFAHLRFNLDDLEKEHSNFEDLFHRFVSGDTVRHDKQSNQDETSQLVIGFVDVPGHGKFLKNMLAGVGGIDMALLVVAADESIMPQTIQHVKILSLLGVKNCVTVLTKVDLADSEDVAYASEETKELLEQFNIKQVACQSVSNVTGEGISELKKVIIEKVLSTSFSDTRFDLTGKPMPCFLPVDRIFSKPGYGVVVTGTLLSGELSVGDNIKIEPAQLDGRVRGLQTFNHKIEKAYPGQRLAVNIATKDSRALERGQCVANGDSDSIKTLIVQIDDLGGLEARVERSSKKLKPQSIRFYHGTAERSGSLRWISYLDGENKSAIGQVYLKEPILAYPGQNYVIRYGDHGIAGGVILMTSRPRWLSRTQVNSIAQKKLKGNTIDSILELLAASPGQTLSSKQLGTLVSIRELDFELSKLTKVGKARQIGNLVIAESSYGEIAEKLIAAVSEAGEDEPVSLETVRLKSAPLMERIVFQDIVNSLIASGKLVKSSDKVALPGKTTNQSELTPEQEKNQKIVLDLISDHILIEVNEVINQSSLDKKSVSEAIKHLDEQSQASLVNYEFVATRESINKAHKVLAEIWNQKKDISPGDFRQSLGTSRKYAMAFLSYFDDQKVTRRLPTGRVLLKSPSS